MTQSRFEERYRQGDTPWDHGMVDRNLIDVMDEYEIKPHRVLDIGCGTGENAMWLGQQGLNVMACDISPTAIRIAGSKLNGKNLKVNFIVADFVSDSIPGGPYDLIFDRGCLHCMDDETERSDFIRKAAGLLAADGYWLSLIGNADEGAREVGPPQLTATAVAAAVEPCFEILSLKSGHFGSDQIDPPRAWICLMRKRAT